MNTLARAILPGGLAIAGMFGGMASCFAQQFDQPWSFSQQNRAQLAVTMKQLKGGFGQSGSSAGSATLTTIVCGGGAATSTANNTCIILNNATGQIETGQDSAGNQSATNSTETTISGNSDADEVLNALSGN
jgi:hypothetical protein